MSDLTTMIVDLLRKKQDEEAVHAGEGEMSPEQAMMLLRQRSTPMQPNPDMLGSGMAQHAGNAIKGRDAQIQALVNEAQ
jgi:hypothetical protein